MSECRILTQKQVKIISIGLGMLLAYFILIWIMAGCTSVKVNVGSPVNKERQLSVDKTKTNNL